MLILMYITGLVLMFAIGLSIRGSREKQISLMKRNQAVRRTKEKSDRPWNPVQRFIRYAEMANFKTNQKMILIIFVVVPVLILAGLVSMHYNLFYTIILVVIYFFVPASYMKMRVTSYHRRFRKELKDDIHLGTSVLRIGDTLENTFREIAEHGAGRVTTQVFADIVHDHTVLQRPLMSVLQDYTERLNIPEFNTFYLLTKVGIASGGNLFFVWERLSDELERLFAFENSARAKGVSMSIISYVFFILQLVLFFFVMPSLMSHIPFVARILVYVLFGFSFGAFFLIRSIAKTRV